MAQFGGSQWNNPQMWNASYGNQSGPTQQSQQWLNWFAVQPQQAGYRPGSVDPSAAIQSAQPGIQENMERNFASAAARLGRPATSRSSPYQTAFGREARGASNDLASITQQNLLNASMFNAGQAQDWAQTQYGAGLSAASQQSAQGYGNQQFQQQIASQQQQDWWNRYYDWYLKGGSPENMNQWQGAGAPLAANYMQQYR